MKLQFKHQKFQADAAKAVVDVFAGQPYLTPTYMMDRGTGIFQIGMNEEDDFTGWRNQPLVPELSKRMILEQIQEIQRIYQITPSQKLEGEGYNLTIEMETGVGKTYTYIKTIGHSYFCGQNNIFNQILKTTMTILIRDSGVKKSHKADLKKIILFFHDIDIIEPSRIRWSSLMYQRNNKNYEMLINICYFVLDGMLQTTDKGNYKMMTFSDEHMHRLYEKFVLEYFKRHHSYLSEVRAAQVKWNLATDTEESMIRFLPAMQTDIFLRYKEKVLIIDTKYYGNSMQKQYDKVTIHSGNMYQIFTYVKNQDVENNGRVSGMLLYAKTEEAITPDCSFVIGGNKISVKTVDLNKEFKLIAAQLDKIAEDYFGKKRIEDSII